MLYFFYCRDHEGAIATRRANTETHWAFMDGYADKMIARGPTLNETRDAPTGSMHIVDLPDRAAAEVFAYQEPFYKAGVFRDVLISRWRNALGGTMWDYKGDPDTNKRFLIIGHGKSGVSAQRDSLLEAHRRYFIDEGWLPSFISRGPLISDDEREWTGSAMLVEMKARADVERMLAAEPYVRAGLYDKIEIFDWRFGGRH
jgi:uncharacterized protein YciI